MGIRAGVSGQKIAFLVTMDGRAPVTTDTTGFLVADLSCIVSEPGSMEAGIGAFLELDKTNHPGVFTYTLDDGEAAGFVLTVAFAYGGVLPNIVIKPEEYTFAIDPDWGNELEGEGFDPSTDSLEEIRDYFDTNILPKLRAQASVTELSGVGWLSDLTDKIRRWSDEPITSSKYKPSVMVPMIEEGIRKLFTEQLLVGDRPLLCRYNVTILEDVQDYVLPPNVSQIWQVAKIDEDTGRITAEVMPVSHWNPAAGFVIEGNILRLTEKNLWATDDVYEVLYLPNGDIKPYKCVLTLSGTPTNEISTDGKTVTLTAAQISSTVDGTRDKRLNGYGGYLLRVLRITASAGGAPATASDDVEQTRGVASSTINASGDLVLTLRSALSIELPATATELVTLELVPSYDKLFEDVLALQVARSMLVSDGNEKRWKLLTAEYTEKCRAFRLQIVKSQMRTSSYMQSQDYDNLDYTVIGGIV